MKKRNICIITGSRAEWGLFYPLAKEIKRHRRCFNLQIIATGMHLSPQYGLTYREIENDGFQINQKVDMLISGDTAESNAKSIGFGIIGMTDALKQLGPDLVFLLGDRFETFSAAVATFMLKIPIAHIHGGELTEAAVDDALRHSITKMATLHFVSTDVYKRRVMQMGELPHCVFNVGALGLDNLKNTRLLSRKELEKKLDFRLGKRNVLITFHPVTLEKKSSSHNEFTNLLKAVDGLKDVRIIFTRPNADMYSGTIDNLISSYVSRNRNGARSFTSMGRVLYLSTLQFMDVVAGNSSSAIIEVSALGIPAINIGDRQKGRVRPATIIDSDNSYKSIKSAFKKAFSEDFRRVCKDADNPYGNGDSSKKIVDLIKMTNALAVKKKFYDVDFNSNMEKRGKEW